MWTLKFWKDAGERAIKTFAQMVVSLVLVVTPTVGFDTLKLNWLPILAVAGIAAILSIFTSLGSSLIGEKDSASLVK